MMKERIFQKEDNKRKKENCDNLGDDKKEQCVINLEMTKMNQLEKMIKKKDV